jgi:predicted dehydrogenase
MTTGNKLRWGIISTGIIAHTLARSLSMSETGRLVAVASRSQEAASRFGQEFGVLHAHGSYEALLENPEVDAVYIATPHPSHAEWAVRAAHAKKHVLCEKPLAMNHDEVSRVVRAARENDVFLMEAFMYRCHPQTHRMVSLLKQGTLGQVKSIQATFGFDGVFPENHRLLNHALGGGGILDLGCYPVSMARLVAGVATGVAFSEPLELHAVGHIGERSRVDEYSAAILKFPGEIVASVASSVQLWQENVVRIVGSEGRLLLREPWHATEQRGFSEILIERPGRQPEVLRVPATDAYGHQLDAVAAQIARREASEMSLSDSLGNALALDRWRQAIGLRFAADAPAA